VPLQARGPWIGVKRIAIGLPATYDAEQAYKLVEKLIEIVPRRIGKPIVVFGSQEAANVARGKAPPFQALSVAEALQPRNTDEELWGPLLIVGTTADQEEQCQIIVEDCWEGGKLLLVVNAQWLAPTSVVAVSSFASSLDSIYSLSVAKFEVLPAR
jgi:hypothetical protein